MQISHKKCRTKKSFQKSVESEYFHARVKKTFLQLYVTFLYSIQRLFSLLQRRREEKSFWFDKNWNLMTQQRQEDRAMHTRASRTAVCMYNRGIKHAARVIIKNS